MPHAPARLKWKWLKITQHHLHTISFIFAQPELNHEQTLDKRKLGDILQNNRFLQKCQYHKRWTKAKG